MFSELLKSLAKRHAGKFLAIVVLPSFSAVLPAEEQGSPSSVAVDSLERETTQSCSPVLAGVAVGKSPRLLPCHFEHMLSGYCHAGSRIRDRRALGGFWASRNFPKRINDLVKRPKPMLYLLALPDEETVFSQRYKGGTLLLVNGTNKTSRFSATDSRIGIVQEAKDKDGCWKPIEHLPSSWCGNSYHGVFLEPKDCWVFSTPRYEGSIKTTLRFTLPLSVGKVIHSNEFEGSVNPGQFARRKPKFHSKPINKEQSLRHPPKIQSKPIPVPTKTNPEIISDKAELLDNLYNQENYLTSKTQVSARKPPASFIPNMSALADSWVGYTNDGVLRYKLTLERRGNGNDFAGVFTLPNNARWRNYANRQNFKLVSIEDGGVVFERSNGQVYSAKLVENGAKMIDGTRSDKKGNLHPNFVNWELVADTKQKRPPVPNLLNDIIY
jgi:hypothetical protein